MTAVERSKSSGLLRGSVKICNVIIMNLLIIMRSNYCKSLLGIIIGASHSVLGTGPISTLVAGHLPRYLKEAYC